MRTTSGSTPHWPESGMGYSRQAWIRFTPPANKLSGEDPDGSPALKHLRRSAPASPPGMTQRERAVQSLYPDEPSTHSI